MPAISGDSSVRLLCAAFRWRSSHFSYVFRGRWPTEAASRISWGGQPASSLYITLQGVVVPDLQWTDLLLCLLLQLSYLLLERLLFSPCLFDIGRTNLLQLAFSIDITVGSQRRSKCTALRFVKTQLFSALH